jgi:hypothetical protein
VGAATDFELFGEFLQHSYNLASKDSTSFLVADSL